MVGNVAGENGLALLVLDKHLAALIKLKFAHGTRRL